MHYFRETATGDWNPQNAYIHYEKAYPGKPHDRIRYIIKRDLEQLSGGAPSEISTAAERWLKRWKTLKLQLSSANLADTTDNASETVGSSSYPTNLSTTGTSNVNIIGNRADSITTNNYYRSPVREGTSHADAVGQKRTIEQSMEAALPKRTRPSDEIDDLFNPPDSENSNPTLPVLPHPFHDAREINLGTPPRLQYGFFIGDTDMAPKFYAYKLEAKHHLREAKMYHGRHVTELQALTHVLLLKPGEYSPIQLSVFKEDELDQIRLQVLNKLLSPPCPTFSEQLMVKLALHISTARNQNSSTWEEFIDGVVDLEREARKLKCMYESKILKTLRNLLELYPRSALAESVSELDLCASFLAPVLAPLFNSPRRRLRWPNTKLDGYQPDSPNGHMTSCRPDGILSDVAGIQFTQTRMYGELKPARMSNETTMLSKDLLRLSVFAKDAIDNEQLTSILMFQGIGHVITFYVMVLAGDGLYAMVEFEKITIPRSTNDASTFLSLLQPLMNVLHAVDLVKPSDYPQDIAAMSRPTLNTPEFRSIIQKPDKKRTSFINFS